MRSYNFSEKTSTLVVLTDSPNERTLELYPSQDIVDEVLNMIQSEADRALEKGDVLFLDQRQLLTFGYITNVPLIPEYEKKVLMEERHLPEDQGLLESKTTSMTIDGSILKIIKYPFCDSCGQTLKDQRIAVCSCKKKICPSCMIIHESKIYCRECAKRMTAITKEDFFTLYGIGNGVGPKDIKYCSSMSQETLEESISVLIGRGLVETKGFSIFSCYAVTDKGLAALATCEQIYRNEGDVLRFLLKIQEFQEEG